MQRIGLLAAWGLLGVACGSTHPCPAGCVLASSPAVISVPCPAGLVAATASGPCTTPATTYSNLAPRQDLDVYATGSGTCHVRLSFTDGYVYTADIQFVAQPAGNSPGCPYCAPITHPVANPAPAVDPGASCSVDAGGDAAGADGASDAAAADGASDAAGRD